MKHRKNVRAGSTLAACVAVGLSVSLTATADSEVPCLVMSGHAQCERHIDLSKLNRITFGPESMIISRGGGDEKETQELLYSLYHHIEIKNAMPDIETGIVQTPASEGCSMRYLADSRSLKFEAPEDALFKTGIFDVKGTLILTAEVKGGEVISLGSLSSGTYIAVATDGKTAQSLKFLVK